MLSPKIRYALGWSNSVLWRNFLERRSNIRLQWPVLWQLKNKCLDPEGGIWATHLSGQLRCQFSVTLSIIPTCILSFTIHAPLRLGVQVVWQLEKCDPLSSSLPTSFLPSFPSFHFLLNNISLKKKSKVEIVFAIDSRSFPFLLKKIRTIILCSSISWVQFY